MGLTAEAAYWFLPAVIPICVFVAWSDMKRMKIPNIATDGLIICYAILGLLALPFVDYLWHWLHFIVMLLVGFILYALRVMGAGDSKFIAAAAPYFAVEDLFFILPLFASCLLAGLATHRIAKYTPIRRAVPDWASWEDKRFPKGFPLSMTLVFYLVLVAIYR